MSVDCKEKWYTCVLSYKNEMKIIVSVIIVHYKADQALFSCLDSLYKHENKVAFEVIVVNNDTDNPIGKVLLKKFPLVRYIQSSRNVGFGGGNNLGAKIAKGKYLLFLNPDTVITDLILDRLSSFLESHTQAAIVAPLLLDKNKKVYPLQGTEILTPFKAFFSLSIINKLFPHNPIAEKYWMRNWDKSKDKEVEAVPGSAFMIRKDNFEKLEGFDEKMFLYFEEYDLCRRTKQLGYQLYITSSTKVIHLWGESTKYRNDLQKIFNHSRFYYFKKHFGLLQAVIIESFLRCNREKIIILAILLLAIFLRFNQIQSLIPFFADQGWFYNSAKNMLLTGHIPLVGITASHIWLHQGAYWTYLLAICLYLFHFNPVSGAYFTAGLDVLTVGLLYYAGKKLFSKKAGMIAASLYATSPLVIVSSRTAYHTSPIPFFTVLLLLALTYWIRGNRKIIPIIIGLLGILYNFEIATISLSFVFFALLLYGYWKKRPWRHIFSWQNSIFSAIAYVITMLPMLLYDISHQFPQTVKIILWIGYKIVSGVGLYRIHPPSSIDWIAFFHFLALEIQRLIFMPSSVIALVIFFSSLFYLTLCIGRQWKERKLDDPIVLIFLFVFIPIGILLINGVLSAAYLPVLLPSVMLVIAFLFDSIFATKIKKYILILFLCIIVVIISLRLFHQNISHPKI